MKKRLSMTLVAIFFAAIVAAFGLLLTGRFTAKAETWSETSLQEAYPYGTQLTIPSRQITVGDVTVNAVSVLTTPDGDATLNTQVVLDVTGIYKLDYTAEAGGKVYRIEEQFEVYDNLARVGDNSYFSYERYKDTATEGLKVGLVSGEEITVSQILDLRSVTKSEPIIELFAVPSTIGTLDYEQINITFTDVENPDCYLKVRGRQSADGAHVPYTYFLAGGNDQPMEGWEGGNWNKLHINDEWGTPSKHSFCGDYGDESVTPDQVKISIRYDAETRCVYIGDTMIIDLDSSLYFSKLWEGFTSGRVRVTLSADVYSASVAEFMITYLKGVDLSAERLTDDVAPEITVNTTYDVAPVAKVGIAYPIPEATAKDDYGGRRPVTRQVRYNYNSSNSITVPEHDGVFVPERAGLYAIVYSAVDRAGNEAKNIVWVNALNEVSAPQITLDGKIERAVAGERVELASYSVSGGSGNAEVLCEVSLNGEKIDCSDGFRPTRVGSYTVKYTACDYIGQITEEQYTVTVEKGLKPIFIDEPILPKYYVSGSEYAVPELVAYDYSDGTEKIIKAKVSVIDANGSAPREVKDIFTPLVINNGDEITLIFEAGDAEPLVRKVKTIKSFEADGGRMRLQMQNYFVTANASAEAKDECVTVTSDGAQSSFDFANALLAEGLSFDFNAIPQQSNYDGLKMTLTDSLNAGESLSLYIMKNGRASYVLIGNMQVELSAGFVASSSSNAFGISYLKNVISIGAASIDVKNYDDGRSFNGFGSGFVYLTVAFVNPQGNAAFNVTDISGQPISSAANDRIRPKITLFGDYGNAAELNSVQVIPRAIAGDVLDPNVTLYLTVTDKSGNTVTANDGTVLKNVSADREYYVAVAEYGRYFVSYVACDTFNGKDYEFGYAINVEDREKPTIEFGSSISKTVKVGELIVIPDFKLSDNVSDVENLIVSKYVYTPTGRIILLPEQSNSFRPSAEGEYEIRITVTDEAGNMTLVNLTVTVVQ